jgi:hypothetical protein
LSTRFCPTCGRANLPPPGVELARATTGEFTAVTDPDGPPGIPVQMPYAGSDCCSWCGKKSSQVKRLLTGPGVQICDECVAFCSLILRDDRPDEPSPGAPSV